MSLNESYSYSEIVFLDALFFSENSYKTQDLIFL